MPSHEQWMRWCTQGAEIFSTCSRRQYMAIVLAPSGRVLGTGYNGVPSGLVHCRDGGCPRASQSVSHGSEYSNCLANHAEENALLHSDRHSREGGTLIINGPPCFQCSKLICGSGVKTVVYKEDNEYADWPKCKQLLESVGITCVVVAANTNEPGHGSGSVPLRPSESVPVDLAVGTGRRITMADRYRAISALGNDPLDSHDDVPYSLELEDRTEGEQ